MDNTPSPGAAHAPRPLPSTRTRWAPVLRSAYARAKVDRVNVAAGAFAYRWFLSIFPGVIALLGFTTLFTVPHRTVVNLIHGVTRSLPVGAAQVFSAAIDHAARRTGHDLATTVVASVVALFSATSGMVIVEEGLDMALALPSDRSALAKRALALPLLAGGVLLGGAASALVIFGPQLGVLVEKAAPVGGVIFATAWTILRWLLGLVLMNLLVTLLYYLAPNRARGRWRWTSYGAVLATVLWALVSLGFSFYTSNFRSFGATYGAFAGVAILIFWLYLTGWAILLGAELNAALERHASSEGDTQLA